MRIIFQRKGEINWIQLFLIAICKQISIFSYFLSRLADCCNRSTLYLVLAKIKDPANARPLKKRFHSVPKNLFGLISHNSVRAPQPAACRHSQLLQHHDSWSTPLSSNFIISQKYSESTENEFLRNTICLCS